LGRKLSQFFGWPEKLPQGKVFSGKFNQRFLTARPPFGQKIVPIFWLAGKTTKLKSRRPQGKVFSGKFNQCFNKINGK
jgi:hypothetical protein